MSIKAKIATGAAAFALVGGGLGLAGTLTASAATPSCTGYTCAQLFSQKFGPKDVADVYHGRAAAGQPAILFQSSNTDPAEDFTFNVEDSVSGFYNTYKLVSPQFAHTYGNDPVVEIEYSPYGVNSNFCLSTTPGQAATAGGKVGLQWCGRTSSSLWAVNYNDATRDHRSVFGYDAPLISGADANFSNPEVLTYPAGSPTDMPRPQLETMPQQQYSNGTTDDNQQWGLQGSPVDHGNTTMPVSP
ncbi:MAG: hypothetical protein JO016_05975 [Actinobacteria bacterium]|nr:hypothetical protein [Actinomycetota bacterium]